MHPMRFAFAAQFVRRGSVLLRLVFNCHLLTFVADAWNCMLTRHMCCWDLNVYDCFIMGAMLGSMLYAGSKDPEGYLRD